MACSEPKRRALVDDLFAVLDGHGKHLCSDCVSAALVQLAAMAMADTRPTETEAVLAQAEDRCELLMESVNERLAWLASNPPNREHTRH